MQLKRIQWDFDAWQEYLQWEKDDKAILKRINMLIGDIMRSPFEGIGKPEELHGNLSGSWSRRINEEHRLVYAVRQDEAIILSCKGHYTDNIQPG